MKVVWLDPGFATGIAVYDGTAADHTFEAFELQAGEAMPWLHRELDGTECPDLVGSEGIHITKGTAKLGDEVLRSVEQIGIARYLSHIYSVDFKVQMPNERKWTTDNKLRALGWWTKGKDHPREATRHLVKWLAENDSEFRTMLVGMI